MNVAVIGCEPSASVDVENVATPLDTVPVPIATPLSKKVTVPVGVKLAPSPDSPVHHPVQPMRCR